MGEQSYNIEYCGEHYFEILDALRKRNLESDISSSSEELIAKLEAGKMDVGLETSNAITATALQCFGPAALLQMGGCPLCAFKNIINHVTDHMAVKYRKTN